MESTTLWLCCWLAGQLAQPPASPPRQIPRAAPAAVQAVPADPRPVPTPDVHVSQPHETTTSPAATSPMAAPAKAPTKPDSVVPVEGRSPRSHAPAVLGNLLTLPDELKPVGRWTPLAEVLASAADPQQQLEATRAYWKLASAVALYRIAADEYQALEAIRAEVSARRQSPDELVEVQVRRGQAAAQLEQAAGKLLEAQYELAQRMRVPAGAPLPLPGDKPHVGTYNTRFEQIYASGVAPPAARFASRTLELRQAQIDRRAAAVQAAGDVLEAEQEAYSRGAVPFSSLSMALERWGRQRRTFLADVVQYNSQIADYALSVPHGGLAVDTLAAMLIKSPLKWSGPTAEPSYVTPATFNQPLPVAGPIPLPPPPAELSGGRREPTLARPREKKAPQSDNEPALLPKDVLPGSEPAVPISTNPLTGGLQFGPHEVQRQPLPASAASGAPADPGLYSALAGAAPAKRAQELAGLLNWNRQLSAESGTPLSLEQCMAALPAGSRQSALAAYWRTRQAMADSQAVLQEIEQLNAAQAAVLRNRQHPRGAEAMLHVRSGQLDLAAAEIDAQLALLAEQFALTQVLGWPLEKPWALPSTAPHGGGYRLKADAQPHAIADSFAFKRSTVIVPALHLTLQQQADAVVLADAERAMLSAAVENGSATVEQLLAAINRQSQETRSFLATLTRYNTEIGSYALAVLPPQTPPDTVVRALVTPAASEKL